MLPAPDFPALVVSSPAPHAWFFGGVRGLVGAAAFYGLGLIALVPAPLLVLAVMDPPKAGIDLMPHVIFNPPGGHHKIPAGNIRQGAGGTGSQARPGAATKAPTRKAMPRPHDR